MKFLLEHTLFRRALTFTLLPISFLLSLIYLTLAIGLYPALLVGTYTNPAGSRAPSRHIRFSLMISWYLLMECIGVLLALLLWLGTLGGYFINFRSSQRAHALVQYFWVASLLSGVRKIINGKVTFPNLDLPDDKPLLIAAQHCSFFDALIPTVLIGKNTNNLVLRHVLKSELLLSPSLDLYGGRLPNCFVTRSGKQSDIEISGIHSLAENLSNDVCVIFPEGTFHSQQRFENIIQRIEKADTNSIRLHRISQLKHLLPVKPGGVLAMITAAPNAQLLFVGHYGLKPFGSMKDILSNIPFTAPIEIYVHQVPVLDMPTEEEKCLEAIDREWLNIDKWIQSRIEKYELCS